MDVVLHPAHTGADAACTGTAYDTDTATYVSCPHPDHRPDAPLIERLTAENTELRLRLQRMQQVAAIYQVAAQASNTRS